MIKVGYWETETGDVAEVIGKSVSTKLGYTWVGLVDFEYPTLWNEQGEPCKWPEYTWDRTLVRFLGTSWEEARVNLRSG